MDEHDVLYRPDNKDDKPALWSNGAFFLGALGFITDDGLIDLESFDPELVLGQVIRVTVKNKAYEKRDKSAGVKNIIDGFWNVKKADVEELGLYFDELRSGMVFLSEAAADDYAEAVLQHSEEGGGVGAEQTPGDVWGDED